MVYRQRSPCKSETPACTSRMYVQRMLMLVLAYFIWLVQGHMVVHLSVHGQTRVNRTRASLRLVDPLIFKLATACFYQWPGLRGKYEVTRNNE